MLVLICFLDIAAFKWRNLADYIIYAELLNSCVVSSIPSIQTNISMFYIAALHFLVFVMYYTDSGAQLIAIAVRQLLLAFLYECYLYMQTVTV